MGVPKFYNMLVFGTQFADTDFRWGFGYGIGTVLPIVPAFSMNVDLFAVQIHEDNHRLFDDYPLNLLNTLRLSFNLHVAKRIALFAGPHIQRHGVAEIANPTRAPLVARIAPSWTIYDQTFNNQTNVKMWPGFHVGLRF